MFRISRFVIEHPIWFTAERFTSSSNFLRNFFIRINEWALQQAEKYTSEEIKNLQSRRLRRLIKVAYKEVPFYKKRLNSLGIRPSDIKSIEDFTKISLLNKAKLQTIPFSELISYKKSAQRAIQIHTFGTTGRPLKIYYDLWLLARSCAFRTRKFRWLVSHENLLKGKNVIYISMLARVDKYAEDFIKVIPVPHFLEYIPQARDKIYELCKKNICVIQANPSLMFKLGELIQRERGTFPLGGIVISGEKLDSERKKFLQDVFECQVGGAYTNTEAGGSIAQTCRAGRYHINSDQCFVEVVDEDGKNLSFGKIGRIVISNLNNFLMPFIRYDTGDIGSILEDRCTCDSPFPIINFEGRNIALMRLPGGKIVHQLSCIRLLARRSEWIRAYKIIRKDTYNFEVLIEANPHHTAGDIEDLKGEFEKTLGADIRIEFKFVSQIERPDGLRFLPFISMASEDKEFEIKEGK